MPVKGSSSRISLGFGDQAAGDFQAPAFAPRKRHGPRFAQAGDVELFEQFVAAALPRFAIHAQHFHHAEQIVLDRQFAKHARLLGQIAHAAVARPAIHRPARHVDVVENDLAGVGLDHAAGHAKAGGLAGAVGAEQSDDLSAIDLEIDAVDDAPPSVEFDQSVDFEHRHVSRSS